MGNVSSRTDEGAALFLRDQQRFSINSLVVTGARGRTLLRISPNSYPAERCIATRELGDDTPVEFVQDTETALSGAAPAFLLRLTNDDELTFHFSCTIRQFTADAQTYESPRSAGTFTADTNIAGLTFVYGSCAKEVEQLMTTEFHADPNIQNNPNFSLLGDFSTNRAPSIQVPYVWKWKPPKPSEDAGGGWRTCCSFVEFDQRTNKLNPLAAFTLWVQNYARPLSSSFSRSPRLETISPQRLRVPSAQSIESRMSTISDSDGEQPPPLAVPQSPIVDSTIPEYGLGLIPTAASSATAVEKFDLSNVGRPGEDFASAEDGPVFRATMKSLESKTGTMRTRMKRVLRTAEAAESAQVACNDAVAQFMEALREASTSNANAVRPALDHYFEKIAKEILSYERKNAHDLRKMIIEPISKLYNMDIKQADAKRRDFEEESKDYYAYVGRYLGQRSESLKEKKRVESDTKYQSKRRTFELKRFDYSSFMHDLHGGRKDQEVLSQLTKYADSQTKSYLSVAKKVEELLPQLDALYTEVKQADKEFQMRRTEREEKRRTLENPRASTLIDPEQAAAALASGGAVRPELASYASSPPTSSQSQLPSIDAGGSIASPELPALLTRNSSYKFKGIRDLEEKDPADVSVSAVPQIRKEGLLWSLSRPGVHMDPIGLKSSGWHKFWIVLDQGRLSEYVNWKDKLDLHLDPIDLRVASVREARNSERRFCFEVITPQYTRVYQAPSEEDMRAWIDAINNALQNAFEAKPLPSNVSVGSGTAPGRGTIAAVLTGKSSSLSGQRGHLSQAMSSRTIHRHATTGDKPLAMRPEILDVGSSELLKRVRDADEGNKYCADCGTESKTEWVSINLGVVLCIECSGIHRSLGTHVSKVRSLTLDVAVFTPDIIELLLLIGNRVCNLIWEARLDRFLKPSPHSTREQRLHFITAKYVDRAYVELDPAHAPDDLLLTSIKRNQIQSVMHALALKADPNARDRSRGTHAVYLALAAADPAMPGSLGSSGDSTPRSHSPAATMSSLLSPAPTTDSSGSTTSSSRPTTPTHRKPFAVAELLLQNGADVPVAPAPIPLSAAARGYLDFKTEQRHGRSPAPGPSPARNAEMGVDAEPRRGPLPTRRTSGWDKAGFVGGMKALGDVGRRS